MQQWRCAKLRAAIRRQWIGAGHDAGMQVTRALLALDDRRVVVRDDEADARMRDRRIERSVNSRSIGPIMLCMNPGTDATDLATPRMLPDGALISLIMRLRLCTLVLQRGRQAQVIRWMNGKPWQVVRTGPTQA